MIDERLRTHMEALAAPVRPDDITDPTYTTVSLGRVPVVRPRAMGRPLALAAVIIAVASVVAFVTDRRPPTLAHPSAWSVDGAASAAFAVESGDPSQSVTVASIVPYRDGLVAVGYVSSDAQSVAAVWTSADGRAWTRQRSDSLVPPETDGAVQPGSAIDQVAVRGRRLVALGVTEGSAAGVNSSSLAAWTSEDGVQWQRHELPTWVSRNPGVYGDASTRAYPSPSAIVATRDGFLAFANDNAQASGFPNLPLVYGSPDGVVWSPREAVGLEQGAYVNGAVVYRGRLVAYGARGGLSGQPTVWTSDNDGVSWHLVPLPFEHTQPDGRVEHATVTSLGLLLTGEARGGFVEATGTGPGQPLKIEGELDALGWLSSDGIGFDQLDTSTLNTADWDDVTAVASTQGGALLAVSRTGPTGRTTHFVSWSTRTGFVNEPLGQVAYVSALVDYRGAFLAAASASTALDAAGSTVLWRAPHR